MGKRIPDHLLSEKQLKKREYNRTHRKKPVKAIGEKKSKIAPEKTMRNQSEKKPFNPLKSMDREKIVSEKSEKNLRDKSEKSEKSEKSNLLIMMRNDNPQKESKNMSQVLKSVQIEKKAELSWDDIQGRLLQPKNGTFLTLLALFSSFLIWQGSVFLTAQGYSQEDAYICSIFGELLLLVSAGLILHAESPGAKKAFKIICGLSILLLGVFLHNGVKSSVLEANPQYKRVNNEYLGLEADVKELRTDKKKLPDDHVTRKGKIQKEINEKVEKMSAYSLKLEKLESSSLGAGQYFIAWLRIALMLLNAYLAHAFLRSLLLATV